MIDIANSNMEGIYPILSMPFDDNDQIDYDDLTNEVEFAIKSGAHGLGIALASELYKLTEHERDQVTKLVVSQASNRVKIVINTGAHATKIAIAQSKIAEELGADSVMIAPSNMISLSTSELYSYFSDISNEIEIPIFIQDLPNAPVPPDIIVKLSNEFENLCYAKIEVPPTPNRMLKAVGLKPTNLTIFGGLGGNMFLEEMRRGSRGTMPNCAIPDLFRSVWNNYENGNKQEAQQLFDKMGTIMRTISQGSGTSSLIVVKEILKARGIFKKANVRQPSTKLDKTTNSEILSALESLSLY